jgi:hypothetical protein
MSTDDPRSLARHMEFLKELLDELEDIAQASITLKNWQYDRRKILEREGDEVGGTMWDARLIGQQLERRFCAVTRCMRSGIEDIEKRHPVLAACMREFFPMKRRSDYIASMSWSTVTFCTLPDHLGCFCPRYRNSSTP